MFSLEGKNALVVGVANQDSLAWGAARQLAAAGARIFLTYQTEDLGKSRVIPLAETIPGTLHGQMDMANSDEIKEVFRRIKDEMGGLDILVHSIAFAPREYLKGSFLDVPEKAIEDTIRISAVSLFTLARHAVPLMEERGGGAIVAFTYLGGTLVIDNYHAIGVAKSSLDHIARNIAKELGPKNIRVNLISAGATKTLSAKAIGGIDYMMAATRAVAPIRRNTDPLDVGSAVVFFSSDEASFITGQTLYVDGGMHILGMPLPPLEHFEEIIDNKRAAEARRAARQAAQEGENHTTEN